MKGDRDGIDGCKLCGMSYERHVNGALSYCPNFICQHHYVKNMCRKCAGLPELVSTGHYSITPSSDDKGYSSY